VVLSARRLATVQTILMGRRPMRNESGREFDATDVVSAAEERSTAMNLARAVYALMLSPTLACRPRQRRG
jgi:hypothetical protein